MAQNENSGNENKGSGVTDEGAQVPSIEALQADLEALKSHSRKWEERAKENLAAKKALDEINAAKMTEDEKRVAEVEKVTADLAAAEARAVAAEAALRRAEIVAAFGLSKDDAEVLSGIADEETLKAVAARFTGRSASGAPKPVGQGQHGSGDSAPVGNAALFAEAMSSLF